MYYNPTFEERIEGLQAEIRAYEHSIAYYRTIGETERASDLMDDIDDLKQEIEEVREEQRVYNHNLGYSLF